jgi:hypothetical protein
MRLLPLARIINPNRMDFSVGRDINLAPQQSGPPVNYFVYPYVGSNGWPYKAVPKRFSFRNTLS